MARPPAAASCDLLVLGGLGDLEKFHGTGTGMGMRMGMGMGVGMDMGMAMVMGMGMSITSEDK